MTVSAVLLGQRRQRLLDGVEVGLDKRQRVADLQHGGGVHDVLGRRAPVDVAAGIAALLGKLMHYADDRVPDEIRLGLELRQV